MPTISAIVIYPFEGEYPGELSVQENQLITVVEQHEDGWSTVQLQDDSATAQEDSDASMGLVPSSYIKILKTDHRRLPPKPPRKQSSIIQMGLSPTGDSPMPQSPTSAAKKQAYDVNLLSRIITAQNRRQQWKSFWAQNSQFKRRRTRISLIKETLSTEETYVRNLKLCLKAFGSLKGADVLFKGFKEITQVNEELLVKLRKEVKNFPVAFVGRVFKEMTSKMVLYTEVINNYDKAFETYQTWLTSNKKPFVSQLNKAYKRYDAELRGNLLESYLILPVQRIPRYRMLLESILKNTDPQHVEYEDIQDALDDIQKLARYIDDAKKFTEHSEVRSALTQIINEYSAYKGIAHNHRRLIRDGFLTISCPQRDIEETKFKCYLLNDLMVITDAPEALNGGSNTGSGPLSMMKGSRRSSQNTRVEYIFMYVTKLIEENPSSFVVSTYHMKETIKITFSSDIPAECATWCKDIRSAITTCGALYSRYELEDDLVKLASDRMVLQEASKENMTEYTKLRMDVVKQNNKGKALQKKIRAHQEELRRLQKILQEEKEQLEEHERASAATHQKCDVLRQQVLNCLDGVRERDKIFSGLLRNESDAFKVIFDDSPSSDALGSISQAMQANGAASNGRESPPQGAQQEMDSDNIAEAESPSSRDSGKKRGGAFRLRSPSLLLGSRRQPPPMRTAS